MGKNSSKLSASEIKVLQDCTYCKYEESNGDTVGGRGGWDMGGGQGREDGRWEGFIFKIKFKHCRFPL